MKLKYCSAWLWAAVLISFLGVCVWLASSAAKVPVFQGKTYYEWANELQKAQADFRDTDDEWQKIQEISATIQAMGSNALPFVMDDLRVQPTIKDEFIAWLAPRVGFLKLKPVNIGQRWSRGVLGMEALGPLGKPYLPELITMVSNRTGYTERALMAIGADALPAFTNLLVHSKYPQTGNLIAAFVSAIYANRLNAEEASTVLPYLAQRFQSSDTQGRWDAATALGVVHQNPELCVPLLITGLRDPTPSVRQACVLSLGFFTIRATNALPALHTACSDPDATVRSVASNSIALIEQERPSFH